MYIKHQIVSGVNVLPDLILLIIYLRYYFLYNVLCNQSNLICLLCLIANEMNESGFRPSLCTYRLNWARKTSWGWWDDWDDTVLQTQDSKFEPWRSEAEHATSRSRRLPTILTFTRGWGRNIFVSFKPPRPGTEPRTLAWKAAVLATTLGPPPCLIATGFCGEWVYAGQPTCRWHPGKTWQPRTNLNKNICDKSALLPKYYLRCKT